MQSNEENMKRAITLEEQIKKLKSRGIIVNDEAKAKEILFDIGYYRLGYYTFPFEKTYPQLSNRNHEFKGGTLFESVVQLYYFDYDLRKLLLAALTRIEVNIRTRITYLCSTHYAQDPYWFMSSVAMDYSYIQSFDKKVYKTIKDSPIIIRHHQKYPNDQYAPAWKTLEFMTLGNIVSLYQHLNDRTLKKKIADSYHCGVGIFVNYLETIRVARNTCAHGAFLYNLKLPKGIKNGPAGAVSGNDRHNVNGILKVILYMLGCISDNRRLELLVDLRRLFSENRNLETKLIIEESTNFSL